jgi:hypothetical protein
MPEYITLENIVAVVTAVVTAAATIAAITPSNADNAFVQKILDAINAFGLNIGKASNKDDPR